MDAVHSGRSRIVVYGGGGHCLWCKKVKPEDAVDAVHSRIVVYGGGDIVFGAKRSNQWMQYTACSVQWNSGIWWCGHCSLVQKGQTRGCSMQWIQWNSEIWWLGHCLWGQKGQTSGHSMQWMKLNSGIWCWGHYSTAYCIHCVHWFDLFCTKDNVPTTIYHYSTASTVYCIHWFDLFAPKTMSQPPYTTILLHTASTVSSRLTFLHQRQCPHHHIPLFHCVLCTASTGLTFLHQHLLRTASSLRGGLTFLH